MSSTPPVQLRHSARAKYLRLRISARDGVELIVPTGVSEAQALRFLDSKRAWVQQHWEKLAEERVRLEQLRTAPPPEELALRAIGETRPIHYLEGRGSVQVRATRAGDITISGDIADREVLREGLLRWLKREAQRQLPQFLDEAAREAGLSYARLGIRAQRSLWGSCTAAKAISLNCKLLLLPPELVRYVCRHELAHTVHLNHSRRFWSVVERLDPHYRTHERALRKAHHYLPDWLQH